jgi:hypothetical protein
MAIHQILRKNGLSSLKCLKPGITLEFSRLPPLHLDIIDLLVTGMSIGNFLEYFTSLLAFQNSEKIPWII